MPEIAHPTPKPGGVHRLWRTIAIGLLIGIAVHVVFRRQAAAPAASTVRGDPLPAPDPRLDRVLDVVDFDHAKLEDVLTNLTNRVGINLIVEWEILHKAGIEKNAPVTLHLKKVTLATALDAVLLATDFASAASWNEFDGILNITTFETADPRQLLVRFYDVQHLLDKTYPDDPKTHAGNPASLHNHEDDLKKLITDNVYPTTWKDNGGDVGSIGSCPGMLLITHTAQAHRKIETLLRTLEQKENRK